MYSEKVMDHFSNPRNVGTIEDPDGIGEVGNPVCGDMMTFYIKVEDDKLSDVKYKTFGCVAAIAVSSKVSEMTKGKTLEEAKAITKKAVAYLLRYNYTDLRDKFHLIFLDPYIRMGTTYYNTALEAGFLFHSNTKKILREHNLLYPKKSEIDAGHYLEGLCKVDILRKDRGSYVGEDKIFSEIRESAAIQNVTG